VTAPSPNDESCVLCGGALAPAVAHPRSSYADGGQYRIDACTRCGAGTTMPRPTPDELARAYEATYGYSTHDLIEAEKRRRAAWLLEWSGVRTGRVLDVGCMFGYLLDECARRGLQTHGVELSPGPAAVAASRGHDVFAGSIEAFAATRPELRFDAIFAQHVIEHVPDPVAMLRTARGLLAPGGRLVACVPNFEARLRRLAPRAWGWYQVPFHLIHFSSRALRGAVEEAGLELVEERTRGGDTLFLALSAAQMLGLRASADAAGQRPRFARAVLRVIGEVTRPYYALGDDEIAIVARA
jgi:SAM-dependent methyltransferase